MRNPPTVQQYTAHVLALEAQTLSRLRRVEVMPPIYHAPINLRVSIRLQIHFPAQSQTLIKFVLSGLRQLPENPSSMLGQFSCPF